MIISPRLSDGRKRPCLSGEVVCPFGLHYHGGDEIEIELEMIICEHQANEMLKKIWW